MNGVGMNAKVHTCYPLENTKRSKKGDKVVESLPCWEKCFAAFHLNSNFAKVDFAFHSFCVIKVNIS